MGETITIKFGYKGTVYSVDFNPKTVLNLDGIIPVIDENRVGPKKEFFMYDGFGDSPEMNVGDTYEYKERF